MQLILLWASAAALALLFALGSGSSSNFDGPSTLNSPFRPASPVPLHSGQTGPHLAKLPTGNFGTLPGAVNMRCLNPPLSVSALIAAIRSVESSNDPYVVGYDWRPSARQNPANFATFKGPTIGLGQIQEPRNEGHTHIFDTAAYTRLVQRSRCFPKDSNCIVLHASGAIDLSSIRFDSSRNVQYLRTGEGVGVWQKRADRLYRWAMTHALGTPAPPPYDVRSAEMQNAAIYGTLALEKGLERNVYAALVGYNGYEPYAQKVLSRVPLPQGQIDCLKAYYRNSKR